MQKIDLRLKDALDKHDAFALVNCAFCIKVCRNTHCLRFPVIFFPGQSRKVAWDACPVEAGHFEYRHTHTRAMDMPSANAGGAGDHRCAHCAETRA